MRLLILGAPASGKTNLARTLSSDFGIPHIEVDQLYWAKEKGGPRSKNFPKTILAALNHDAWVVEGLARQALPFVQDKLTHVHLHKVPYPMLVKRTFKRFKKTYNAKECAINMNPFYFYRREKIHSLLLRRGIKPFETSTS